MNYFKIKLDKALSEYYIIYNMRHTKRNKRTTENFHSIVARLITKGYELHTAEKYACDIRLGLRTNI